MYAIFSIDGQDNPFNLNIFHNYIAELEINHGSKVVHRIGCYKGQKENCYVTNLATFMQHISNTAYIAEQESVLWVASGNKQEAHLEYLADGRIEPIGSMHSVCKEEAMQSEAWTHDPITGNYWVAKQGNNDGSYRRSCEQYRKGQDQ